MEDRKLLYLAAKAADFYVKCECCDQDDIFNGLKVKPFKDASRQTITHWNPLNNNGDALQLAVKLGMFVNVEIGKGCVDASLDQLSETPREWLEFDGVTQTMEKATRRAIVRCAAELGKYMP